MLDGENYIFDCMIYVVGTSLPDLLYGCPLCGSSFLR